MAVKPFIPMKKTRIRNDGFTLIEVLVAISIVGVLVSLTYASLNSAKAKGRDAKRISDSEQMKTALTSYSLDHGGVPAANVSAGCVGASDGASWICDTTASIANVLAPLVSGKYISSIPTDPVNANGLAYYYTTPAGTFDSRTGINLAPNASFSYVSESQTSDPTSPVISSTNIGTPDYTTYPDTGYPAGGGSSGTPAAPVDMTLNVVGDNNIYVKPGSGTVTSSPAGLSCSSADGTCTYSFPGDATVTLSAVASQYSVFEGWSGACSGTGACTVSMSAGAPTITAKFNSSFSSDFQSDSNTANTKCSIMSGYAGGTGWHVPSQSELTSAMTDKIHGIFVPNGFTNARYYQTSTMVGSLTATFQITSAGTSIIQYNQATTSNMYGKCLH